MNEGTHGDGSEISTALWRGFRGWCPRCGAGRLFGRFLKVEPGCTECGQEFHHHRADDFPPYIVMFLVGHLVGLGIYETEMRIADVPIWLHATIWPALTLTLCLLLLQPVKGSVVGLQWALGMHGFSTSREPSIKSGSVPSTEEDQLGSADRAPESSDHERAA